LPGVLPPASYCHEIATSANKGATRKAYFLTERYDEAIGLINKWIHHYPAQWSFYRLLAIAYNLLGREDDKMEVVKVLKIDPDISVKLIKKTYRIAIRIIKIDLLVHCEKQECLDTHNSDNNSEYTLF
jgi:hypothetical protein